MRKQNSFYDGGGNHLMKVCDIDKIDGVSIGIIT